MYFRLPVHIFLYAACSVVSVKCEPDWHYEGINIAYGKPATQGPDTYSNTLSSGLIKNYTADLAVDGNISRKFEDLSCTHTVGPSSTNASWTVDLQKTYKITGIIIYNRDNKEGGEKVNIRLENFIIYGNGNEVIHNSKGSDEYMQPVIRIPLDGNNTFSSITIQLPANDGKSVEGKYFLSLCEVEIYAEFLEKSAKYVLDVKRTGMTLQMSICEYMNITNGEMKPNQYLYEVNTQADVVCNEGFEPQIQNITCNNSKKWTDYEPCSRVYCAYPDKPINGDYVMENVQNHSIHVPPSLPYGSNITVRCDQGYRSKNTEIRTCQNDGTWSREVLCEKIQIPTETSKAGLIAGTVSSAGLIISVTLVAVFIIYRRRRRQLKENTDNSMKNRNKSTTTSAHQYADGLRSNDVGILQEEASRVALDKSNGHDKSAEYSYVVPDKVFSAVASSSSLQNDREYYSFTGMERMPATAKKIQDLSDINLSGSSAKDRFKKEFESLPQGMVEAHKAALKPQNKGKNRYKNLYAYDDTRVILDVEDEPDSDYINACFVHGFNKTRKYVASQGPTTSILNDFWRMIWQTECCKIVMLTNLHEEGKVKCDQYWPSHGSQTYGKIMVKMKQTEPFSQFVIRTFTVQKDGCPERNVTQFHFTAWPDRGVPKYASSIVQFLSKVKNSPSHGDGPIVVHCSAGVGRTGTFIALDNVTEQGKAVGYVDVAGVVESMRKQRVNSVQTLEQYIFVYQAVTEALMLSSSAMPAAKFPDAYTNLLRMDPKKKKRKLSLDFEALKKMSPVTEESQYTSPTLVRNRNKNRYSNVLPIEEYMPSLTKGDGSEDCEYINAVFLPSYKEKKAFIITQTPLESTVEDFWRLIWEHDVHTLIMMNSLEEMTNAEVYWPNDNQTISFGNIYITNDRTMILNKHIVLSLTVKKFVVSRHIRLFQVGGWQPPKSLPESTDVILSLMELVQNWHKQIENYTILVHCMNGVEKSGLFCVISAVIERMKIEQDVAITQVIEDMRNAREQIISSVEQFQFCHEAVLAFIHQYDTYSNFNL